MPASEYDIRLCEEILARARDASGGTAWDAVAALHAEGTIAAGGLSGLYEQRVALADGRSSSRYTLGPVAVAKGFDGTSAWQRGPTGEVIVQDSAAAVHAAVTEAWLNARGFVFASRGSATFEWLGEQEDGPRRFHAIRATPIGGQPVTLWFDVSTHLLARVVQSLAGKTSTRRFDDYRAVDRLRLPFRSATGTGDPRFDVVIELARIAPLAAVPHDAFERPAQAFSDFSFLAGDRRAVVAIELVNNHVYVPVTIAGHVFQFIVDTGGVNLLTPEAAARAGIVADGAMEARGPGPESVKAGFASVARIEIGGAVALERQLFRVLPFPGFADVEGTTFDGAIGVEVFKRFVVGIDYARRALTLEHPDDAAPPALATTLPLTFYGHFPTVAATLDGIAGQFWLDTGNRNALTLWAPFVEEHALGRRYAAGAETTIGWGLGGRAAGRVARGGTFSLGGSTLTGPVLTLKAAGDDATALRDVAGNIGGDLLRRFTVTFDYARGVVHLVPNARLGQPFDHDRSGLWINRRGDGFVVATVQSGSPAHAAGVRVEDVIVAVDGQPVDARALDAFRARLRESAVGTTIALGLRRGAATVVAEIVLRDLVEPDPA